MNSKQSISVLLMLGLLAPLTACGETKESEGSSSPAVIQSPGATSATKEEGAESGGESGESEAEKEKEKKEGKESKEGGEGGEGT
jgi:hypothetical protein